MLKPAMLLKCLGIGALSLIALGVQAEEFKPDSLGYASYSDILLKRANLRKLVCSVTLDNGLINDLKAIYGDSVEEKLRENFAKRGLVLQSAMAIFEHDDAIASSKYWGMRFSGRLEAREEMQRCDDSMNIFEKRRYAFAATLQIKNERGTQVTFTDSAGSGPKEKSFNTYGSGIFKHTDCQQFKNDAAAEKFLESLKLERNKEFIEEGIFNYIPSCENRLVEIPYINVSIKDEFTFKYKMFAPSAESEGNLDALTHFAEYYGISQAEMKEIAEKLGLPPIPATAK